MALGSSGPKRPSPRSPSRTSNSATSRRRGPITVSAPPTVRMYDSATRSVREFEPLVPGELGVYNCGPTVYDWQHIGNLYSYLNADVARRTFEYLGYRVKQVM